MGHSSRAAAAIGLGLAGCALYLVARSKRQQSEASTDVSKGVSPPSDRMVVQRELHDDLVKGVLLAKKREVSRAASCRRAIT